MGTPMVLCPYCGSLSTMAKQCNICSGYFDLLSRQRSQNAMGPWFIRDLSKPFQPGCSYATLVRMAQRGRIKPDTVIRGPSTRQFWSFARQTPGVANLLGECHACHKPVMPTSNSCPNCKASFLVSDERQTLGLSPVHLLPGDADAETIARSLSGTPAPPPVRATPAPEPTPQREPQPEPVVSAPVVVPEPQVVVEEPEWIEEESETESGSRVGMVIALLVFVVMMGGAGVWAWLHLSSRGEEAATPVGQSVPAPVDDQALADASGRDLNEPAETSQPPESSQTTPTNESESPRIEESSAQESSTPDPPAPPPEARTDPERLEYDRILVGIASGSMERAEFEAQLGKIRSDLHTELERAWQARRDQLRLGRSGE